MRFIKFVDERTKEEYFTHSNIVYLATFIGGFFFTPIFFVIANISVAIVVFCATFFVAIAIILNFRAHYAVASLVYIAAVSLLISMLTVMFGLDGGFQYLFLAMAVLIIFAHWSLPIKIIALILNVGLFVSSSIHASFNGSIIEINHYYLLIFLIFNILASVFAVARTSYHYLTIARKAENTLIHFAETDFLTKLPNRAAFHSFVEKMKEAKEKGKFAEEPNLALLMIDLDNFKNVNDLHGHQLGDLVLIEIGKALKKTTSEHDFLARYGGEEFVIVRFVETEKRALKYANQVREEIESRTFRFGNVDIKLTISAGVLFKPNSSTLSCDEIITEADKLLYKAKKAGRNRVFIKTIN